MINKYMIVAKVPKGTVSNVIDVTYRVYRNGSDIPMKESGVTRGLVENHQKTLKIMLLADRNVTKVSIEI